MITEREYRKRRETFGKKLKNGSVAVLFTAEPKTRSNDTEYPYRQNSNFYYMSGFKEDSAALVLVKTSKRIKSYLFVHKKDAAEELWNGKRLGVEKAKERFDVSDVFEYGELNAKLKEFLAEPKVLYYDFGLDYSKVKLLKRYAKNIDTFKNAAKKIQKMRLIKSDAEVALIRKALTITQEAHHRAVTRVSALQYEYELQAEIEYVFKKNGAYSDAYTSIVASGNNANTLHYITNDQKINHNDLILIDAGCEYDYYASDITRTIPAKGRFSKVQKELYNLVLSVNKEIIECIKPGVLRSQLQQKSEEMLCRGLVELGILKGSVKKLLKKGAHKKYYPHGIGHWMGIDVHDACPYKDNKGKEIPLQPGMVLTIEPGIYIDKDDMSVPKRFRGIGIRIEDDILVTKDGFDNLSKKIKKETRDIESLASL
ncbi:M24 family metallopeptidase [Sulfurimonas paralvinellae]|uniref:Xaa-Pro aminopeptidase n=2 Tax=Sulfurimonas paralvinellae TaxID=317658 RepID=A0A7M1BAG0_9BACT|nr:M24 family metallopeptidase [Sulfurimonas paralvinellae]